MEIFKAHQQWKSRPADERFPTLDALYEQTRYYADHAKEIEVPWEKLSVAHINGEMILQGEQKQALMTNWAFGRLCSLVEAPANYLRELPGEHVQSLLNYGMSVHTDLTNANLLFHQNGGLVARAITTSRYSRLWNYEIAERLLDLQDLGWVPATPDKNRIWSPEQEGVTALYASDHDMFAFLRTENITIEGSGDANKPIYKGLIVSNSEVGASSFVMMKFLYNSMCGNHIIWGASDVTELRLKHVGNIKDRFSQYALLLKEYSDESVSDIEAKIKKSKEILIGATKEEVLDLLFGNRRLGLSRKSLNAGYDACVEEEDGSPRTPWGIVAGLTRYSQTLPYADERTQIDRNASRILDVF